MYTIFSLQFDKKEKQKRVRKVSSKEILTSFKAA